MQISTWASLPSGTQRIRLEIRPAVEWSAQRIIAKADLRNGADGELRKQADESEADLEADEEEDMPFPATELVLRQKNHEKNEPRFSRRSVI